MFQPHLVPPEAWVRVRARTDGRSSFLTWQGAIYAVIPGVAPVKLFQILGMSVARCYPQGPGWAFTSREINLYLDPRSGEKLSTWHNPWTGATVPVVHVANSPVQRHFSQPMPALVHGPWTTFLIDLFPLYPNPLAQEDRFAPYSPQPQYQAAELFKLTAPTAELAGDRVAVSQVLIAWDRLGPWLPWLAMGDRPGHLLYSAWGCRVEGFEALPPLLRQEIEERLPSYRHAPREKTAATDMTSWRYFQEHFAAYQRGDRFPIAEPSPPPEG